jgi:hypothetical protein
LGLEPGSQRLRMQACILFVSETLVLDAIMVVTIKTGVDVEATLVALEAFCVIPTDRIADRWTTAANTGIRQRAGFLKIIGNLAVKAVPRQ